MAESIIINSQLFDAPAMLRKAWPLSQSVVDFTGSEQVVAIGNQFLQKSLSGGFDRAVLVFDLGGSHEKMVAENKRDKKKAKYNERPFVRGLISSDVHRRSPNFLQVCYHTVKPRSSIHAYLHP